MKQIATTTLFLFAITVIQAQEYCVPPPFTSGPFAGITKVKLDSWKNTTSYDGGYNDFTDMELPELTPGEDYDITIEAEHTIAGGGFFSGDLNFRVWIDWNQDGDFDDEKEEVVANRKYYTDGIDRSFTVPNDAKEGETRMRVYNDMPENEGHDVPTPCGYLGSTNPIGHHGEVEDYTVKVVHEEEEPPLGIANQLPLERAQIISQPGAIELSGLESATAIQVYDISGQIILSRKNNSSSTVHVDTHSWPAGLYIVQLNAEQDSKVEKVIVQ